MISSIKVTSGYAAKLPALKKKLEFQPGLNILFGPNGCGKTTVIRLLGAYSMVPCGHFGKGGWSSTQHGPLDLRGIGGSTSLPRDLSKLARGCEAKVDWDGTPAFLNDATLSDVPLRSLDDESDGIFATEELLWDHCSSGEMRYARLGRMMTILKSPPDLTKMPDCKSHNDTWRDNYQAQVDYVKSLPRDGRVTLLLDEPDRSLGIPVQVDLWNVLPKMAEKIQVIVATHSTFALRHKEHIIDMKKGYVAECEKVLETY